jgi:hypothetical protein
MNKLILATLIYGISLVGLLAQEPADVWVMSYVRAKQPIWTMIENEGEFEMDDSPPQDSTYLFSPGLMVIDFREDIKSYSWEGEEKWTSNILKDSIYLFGQRDTLFGIYNEQKIILSSTLDDRPTEYHFDRLSAQGFSRPDLTNKKWKVKAPGHHFDRDYFEFKPAGEAKSSLMNDQHLFIEIDQGILSAFEFDLLNADNEQEYGIAYLYRLKGKTVRGVFYAAPDDINPPVAQTLKMIPRK